MKKNVIGHMTTPKSPNNTAWVRQQLIPALLSLVCAVLIWLAVKAIEKI